MKGDGTDLTSLRGWLAEERPWLERIDFAILKTLMMLAAADGEVSDSELEFFRRLAGNFQDNVCATRRKTRGESASRTRYDRGMAWTARHGV